MLKPSSSAQGAAECCASDWYLLILTFEMVPRAPCHQTAAVYDGGQILMGTCITDECNLQLAISSNECMFNLPKKNEITIHGIQATKLVRREIFWYFWWGFSHHWRVNWQGPIQWVWVPKAGNCQCSVRGNCLPVIGRGWLENALCISGGL